MFHTRNPLFHDCPLFHKKIRDDECGKICYWRNVPSSLFDEIPDFDIICSKCKYYIYDYRDIDAAKEMLDQLNEPIHECPLLGKEIEDYPGCAKTCVYADGEQHWNPMSEAEKTEGFEEKCRQCRFHTWNEEKLIQVKKLSDQGNDPVHYCPMLDKEELDIDCAIAAMSIGESVHCLLR